MFSSRASFIIRLPIGCQSCALHRILRVVLRLLQKKAELDEFMALEKEAMEAGGQSPPPPPSGGGESDGPPPPSTQGQGSTPGTQGILAPVLRTLILLQALEPSLLGSP